jgi:hypothetical protein
MSYEEKGKWVGLVVSLGTFAAYLAIITSRRGGGPLDEVGYVAPMLWCIGIGIVAAIVLRILVEIARPSDSHRIDARDKEINRFGEYVSGAILGVAMLVPLALAMTEAKYFWIANAIYLAYVIAATVGTVTKLFLYRRGM